MRGGIISLASCSSDEPIPNEEPGSVTFTVQLPADQPTRTGEGNAVNQLSYAIYDQNPDGSVGDKRIVRQVPMTGGTAVIHEKLVPGKTYTAAFWAANEASPYTFNADTKTMTVNTAALTASSENGDGFFGSLGDISTAGNGYAKTVTLKRPFAQINLGTDDYAALTEQQIDLSSLTCSMTVTGGYTTLDLFTGQVSGDDTQALTYAAAARPTTQTYPQKGYDYLAYAYVLLPPTGDQAPLTVSFATNNADLASDSWNSVPAKRNMRTNIYGSLLTDPADITVEVNANWDNEPGNNVMVWDGTMKEPQQVDGVYQITNPSEWAYLTIKTPVANTLAYENYPTYTLNLTCDMDMANLPFYPLAGHVTIQGNGHTIQNLNLAPLFVKDRYYNGLVAYGSLTVSDLTIDGVTADVGADAKDGFTAVFITNLTWKCNASFSNVTVNNASIKGVQGVSIFVGMQQNNQKGITPFGIAFNNCAVNNAQLTNYAVPDESGYVGAFLGKGYGGITGSGNTLKDVTVNAYYAARRGENSINLTCSFVGALADTSVPVNEMTYTETGCSVKKTEIE